MPVPLPTRLRAALFAQLAAMEQAGLPTAQAWGLLKLQGVAPARLQAVRKAAERGNNPAVAAQKAGLFSALESQLVHAGLAAGSPLQVYRRLADRCAQRAQNEGALRSRMLLPIAVGILALCIQPLPQWVTGTLTLAAYLGLVLRPLLGLTVAVLLTKRLIARGQSQRWLLQLPLLGPALCRRNARDFFENLALLLEAGLAMFEALPLAVASIEHGAIRSAYAGIKPLMQRGAPLSEALMLGISEPRWLGDPQVIEFIRTGEASGRLPEMLFRHAALETQGLNRFDQQMAQWLPRLVYAGVALALAYALLSGGGVGPRLPAGI
jgi:general secretion pathway protein F